MEYCADLLYRNFPLVAKKYYEDFDLPFQFTPTTYKNYSGYFDSWDNQQEWHILTSRDIENTFSELYPEKII
jgi:hypothetical protein